MLIDAFIALHLAIVDMPFWTGSGSDNWTHPLPVETFCLAKVHYVEYHSLKETAS